ncbi:MAG: box helicase protein [Dehalococcoidia bacterium]|nr:box helicase protein [Dehalococcoidia bacterium]
MSILIGLDNPLDQYFMRHPEDFFHKSFEHALINPDNPNILRAHLLCAAWELPLEEEDERVFGPLFAQTKAEMEGGGMLRRHGRRSYITPALSYPAQGVSIRSTSAQRYAIIESGQGAVLETVDSSVAFFQIHTGAVHLHMGEPYLITKLDLPSRTAYAVPTDVPYYTQTKDITDVRVIRPRQQKRVGEVNVFFGEVKVTTEVLGFRKKAQFTEEVMGEEILDLPAQRFDTMALWFDMPAESLDRVSRAQLDLAGGLHAAEHAAIAMLPLFALCDRNDIGGVSTLLHPDTGQAQIFIYDAHPGGIGIAEKGFELVRDLWQVTLKVVRECPCEDGCPSCVHSPKCGNNNQPLDKKAAELLLEGLLA